MANVEAALLHLKKSLGGLRTAFSQAITNSQRLVASMGPSPAPLALTLLEEAHSKLKISHEKLTDCLSELVQMSTDQDAQKYEEKIEKVDEEYHQCSDSILQALQTAQRPATAPSITSINAGTRAPGRIDDSLKPRILSLDMNPAEFRAWSASLRDWHSFNKMELFPLSQQHRFLLNVVDTGLRSYLEGRILPDTPVFSNDATEDTCMNFLEEEFALRYPTIQRRALYFRYSQPKNMRFTEYLTQLLLYGAEADLHTLDVNGIHCFKAIVGASDPVLREKLLKLDPLTLDAIKREARAYEIANEVAKAIDSPAKSAKVSSKAMQNKPSMKREELRRKKLCFNCGQDKHENSATCPHRDELFCNACKKKGHVQKVCLGWATPKSKAASPSRPSSPSPPKKESTKQI